MRTANVVVVSSADRNAAPAAAPAVKTITADRTWTVGRSPDCDVVVDDNRVSRQHLIVDNAGPEWAIRDVSANGSWINGVRVAPAGVVIPESGELRLRLGDPAGPEVLVAGVPATALASAPVAPARAELPTVAAPYPVGAPGVGPAQSPPPPPPPQFQAQAQLPPQAQFQAQAQLSPVTPPRPRRRRARRWLIAVVVVFALLLVIADRVAASAASTAAVAQIVQRGQGLGTKPTVSFGGIPFLTQVAFGNYRDIAVGIDDITPPGGPRIEHVAAHLEGAHIPLSKALHDDVSTIPVDHVAATVTIGFADLNAFLKNQPGQLALSAGQNGAVQISGNVTEDSTPITVSGSAKLQAQGGQLVVTPVDIHVTGTGGFDDLISGLGGLAGLFPPIPVPLPDLPFNVRITAARASSTAVVVSAAADHLVLDASQ